MSSTFSNLKFELIGNGEQSGTWGTTTNTNIGTAIEQAVVGMATLDSGDFTANVATLTLANTNAAQDARALCLNIDAGAVSAAGTINVPAIQKPYIIINGSSYTVTVKVSGQTGVAVPPGKRTVVYNNGTDVGDQISYLSSLTLLTALPVASGGTGSATLTANNVLLGNGTSALQVVAPGTTGNVLTSDGTTWGSAALPAGGLTYIYTTTPVTATDKQGVLADTSGGAFTVTLPATPSTGAQVVVADAGSSWGTNNLTVARNGSTINGTAENLVCDISGVSVQFVYDGTTWEVYAQIGGNGGNAVTLTGTQTLTNKTLTSPVVTQNIQVINTNTTAVRSRTYVFTATLTLTLPASPAAGDMVMFSNNSGTTTPVIGRNGSNIEGLAEDMTVDNVNYFGTLVYADATRGWIFQ